MKNLLLTVALLGFAVFAAEEEGFVPMFNGKDLAGWVNANCAPETWTVKDGVVCCTGKPIGALRTERQYENFILEAEWRHLSSGGNSGIFIWGTPITAPGQPFLRGIEVQVLENGYPAKGKNEWYTTHGDVFPIHGATMTPLGKHKGSRSFPSEERSKSSPEWNHYRVVCNNGSLRLHVNGKEVSGGDECNYRKGYLALESEGAPVEFRNVRIKELPSTNTPAELTAPADQGFRHLYNGVDLRGWKSAGGEDLLTSPAVKVWEVADWRLVCKPAEGFTAANLVSEAQYGDSEWLVDFKRNADLTSEAVAGVKLNGQMLHFATAKQDLGVAKGKWVRFRIQVKGGKISYFAGDKEIQTVDAPAGKSSITLLHAAGVEYANIFVRELK